MPALHAQPKPAEICNSLCLCWKLSVISFYHLHIIVGTICQKYFCAGYQHEGDGVEQEVKVVSRGEDQV